MRKNTASTRIVCYTAQKVNNYLEKNGDLYITVTPTTQHSHFFENLYVALFIASSERNSQDGQDTLACARGRIRAAYAALQDAIKNLPKRSGATRILHIL